MLDQLVRDLSPRIQVAIRPYALDDDDVNDILQECWIRILNRLDSFRRDGSFAAWAITVSKNVARKAWRKRKRVEAAAALLKHGSQTADHVPDPEEVLSLQLQRRILSEALARLPDRERDVVVLRLLEGRSAADTAAALGMSVRAARAALDRAMHRLRGMKAVRRLLIEWDGGN
ncbi:MAG: sigma-70 family RNA polymerase sigma factor [Gemmatimonadetes bacterium]|nr:sigma-70 family RNA polymerase sigma factor [Gemmatimonadota bacterium]MYC91043.1 sigma-70 family RNA polymerase sigma factor [Gemmatimonadota bacterium]